MTEFEQKEKFEPEQKQQNSEDVTYGYQHRYFSGQGNPYVQSNLDFQNQQSLWEENRGFSPYSDSVQQPVNPYVQTAQNNKFYSPLRQRSNFWRVWPISLAFMMLHVFVLNLAALLLSFVFMFRLNFSLENPDAWYEVLLNSKMQNYASILMALICVPIYLAYLKYRNKRYQNSFVRNSLQPKSFFSMSLGAFGTLGLVTLAMLLLEYLGNFMPVISRFFQDYEELIDLVVSNDESIVLQIIGTVILVPIAEELLFRGIVLGELNLRYSPKTVVILQALLFGLFHMNPIQSFYTFIPGLFLGIAYYKTQNIIVPIIGHMIFNLFGGVLNVFASAEILNILNYAQIMIGIFTLLIIIRFFVPKYTFSKAIHLNKTEKNVASK